MNSRKVSSISLPGGMFELQLPFSPAVRDIWVKTAVPAIGREPAARYVSAIIPPSRNFVHDDLVGDATQCGFLLDRRDRGLVQNVGNRRRFDHRSGDMHGVRDRQSLHPRGDIDGLAEIVLALVEHHREAWPFMNADLDDEVLPAALL